MKKSLVFPALVIVIIAGGIPFVNGLLMERAVRQACADLNTRSAVTGAGYHLEIIDWQRHFFSSDIEWKIAFDQAPAFAPGGELLLVDHARHGFTGVVSSTNMEKTPWFKNFVDERLGGVNPFTLTTSYSLFDAIESRLQVAPFTTVMDDRQVDIGEGEITVRTDEEVRKFSVAATWQGMQVAGGPALEGLAIDAQVTLLSSFLWEGTIAVTLDDGTVPPETDGFSLSGLAAVTTFTMSEDGSRLSAAVELNLAALQTAEKNIDGIAGTLAVQNMSAVGYEKFMQAYTDIGADIAADLSRLENDPEKTKKLIEQKAAEIGFQLIAAYENLLNEDLELQLRDVTVGMPAGDIRADITLRLLRDMTLMQFAPLVGQPALALDVLFLDSAISLPKSLVDDPEKLLAPISSGMQTGLFVEEGDTLIHHAETRNGKLYLNGSEVVFDR